MEYTISCQIVTLCKSVNIYFLRGKIMITHMSASMTQPVKLDLNKKSFPKQKTIQNFTIDAQGFRKTKNENPPTWEMGVTS